MIVQINGKVLDINKNEVILEVNSLGYAIIISSYTYESIKALDNVTLYTVFQFRDDYHYLYGFYEKIEREVFQKLIKVNGVGSNMAINILSKIHYLEFIEIIISESIDRLTNLKGIGNKISQRIMIELKGKFNNIDNLNNINNLNIATNKYKNEALSALEVLGINRKLSNPILNDIIKNHQDFDVEFLVKETLKRI